MAIKRKARRPFREPAGLALYEKWIEELAYLRSRIMVLQPK